MTLPPELTRVLASSNIQVGQHLTVRVGSITLYSDDIISTVIAGAILIGIGFYLRSRLTSGVPGKLQLAFETIVEWINTQVESSMGEGGRPIIPLAVTLFFFILIGNWLELIPSGHDPQFLPSPTGDINFVAAMAVFVIVSVHVTWIRRQGLRRYLGHYTKPYKFLLPINVIEEIVKPVTLTLRLFGNIFAGGVLLILIAALFPTRFIIPIPLADVVWKWFDGVFVGPVQAFIFTLLTILYFQAAVAGEH